MSAQYDGIAAAYRRTKTTPLREHVESYSFLRMLGDVQGLRVLDLACGDGFYARALQAAGAAEVVGVDISAAMVALARATEALEPQGISYLQADVAELGDVGQFDVVSAAYLLHYAPSVAALRAMCSVIARCLKPGGRLVSLNENPRQPEENYPGYTQYGFNKEFAVPRTEASSIRYAMVSGREVLNFEAYYYSSSTYGSALSDVGLAELQWLPLEVSEAGIAALGAEFFASYLANPPVIGLECRRV